MSCETLQNQLEELMAERRDAQKDLSTAAPGEKSGLVSQIKRLNKQIAVKKSELDICLANNPTPNLTPLSTTFSGTFELTLSHPSVPMPLTGSISASALFNAPRTSVLLTALSPLSASFNTPLGMNTTTVSLIGSASGIFDKPTGQMSLMLSLFFDHSIDLPFYEEDSRLDIPLGTGAAGSLVGSPLDASGAVALVGSAVLAGGFLGGTRADLAIMGTFPVLP
jgi:hypothetical protein